MVRMVGRRRVPWCVRTHAPHDFIDHAYRNDEAPVEWEADGSLRIALGPASSLLRPPPEDERPRYVIPHCYGSSLSAVPLLLPSLPSLLFSSRSSGLTFS